PVTFGHFRVSRSWFEEKSESRAVVTLNHDDIRLRLALAQFLRGLVFGGMVAGERRLIARELQHHDTAAPASLHDIAPAAAHQITAAELAEWHLIGDQVWLVGISVGHVDLDDPVAFVGRGWRRRWRRRLRAVVTFGNDKVAYRMRQPQRLGALIFVRPIA